EADPVAAPDERWKAHRCAHDDIAPRVAPPDMVPPSPRFRAGWPVSRRLIGARLEVTDAPSVRLEVTTMATTTARAPTRSKDPLSTDDVWHAIEKRSCAILGYATPYGDPRSSGVMYKTSGRHLFVAVEPDGWKARHIARSGRVSVTVPVHRAGILALVAPIP